jgi:hypothetical protein
VADVVDLSSFRKKKEERATLEAIPKMEPLLDEEEYQTFVESFVKTSDNDFTEEELVRVIDWAEEAALTTVLFELVLDGEADIALIDGKIGFIATDGKKKE